MLLETRLIIVLFFQVPNEAVYKRNTQTVSNQVFSNSTNLNRDETTTTNTNQENSNSSSSSELTTSSDQNQPPNASPSIEMSSSSSSQQQQQTALLLSVKNLIDLYEEILPVIIETTTTTTKPNISNSLSVKSGKFEICFINERRLSYKKREFINPFDYIRELKMIK